MSQTTKPRTILVTFGGPSPETLDVDIGEQTTAAQAVQGLVQNGFLTSEPPGGGEWVLLHKRTGTNLVPAQSLLDAGVRDGDFIKALGAGTGAASVAVQRRARRALDFAMLDRMVGPGLAAVEAFASIEDVPRGRALPKAAAQAGAIEAFLATLATPMLRAPGERLAQATFLLDISHPDYPFAPPTVFVRSTPVPFCVHIAADNGLTCIGRSWEANQGHKLLAELVVDLARFCNLDEPLKTFDGLNREAWRFWQEQLGGQPLDPGYDYPKIPDEMVDGGQAEACPLFVPRRPQPLAAPASFAPRTGNAAASAGLAAAPGTPLFAPRPGKVALLGKGAP